MRFVYLTAKGCFRLPVNTINTLVRLLLIITGAYGT